MRNKSNNITVSKFYVTNALKRKKYLLNKSVHPSLGFTCIKEDVTMYSGKETVVFSYRRNPTENLEL